MLERLVIQALNAGVTAEELCGSETSWGPDYIGSDQKFCDMADKVVSPLCELEDVDGCIEFDDTDLSIKKKVSCSAQDGEEPSQVLQNCLESSQGPDF